VLTLGHLVDYKDPATWLEAARLVRARVPATRLVWLGEGPLLEPMRAAAADDPDIEFAGYRQDVEVHYARADVYFQPSLRENHSIAVLDAMASGLPCVTSDRGGLPEQVQEDETGHLCPAGDADAFAARITALLQEPERARAMGAAGRERAHTLFSPQAQEQRILDIYRRVLQA
jgi:glycosyltransferase involved in cell wall biosynthesis